MKTLMAMLALAVGLSFGSATFVQADEMKKEAAPAAAEKKAEGKKDEGKKAEKKEAKKAEKK